MRNSKATEVAGTLKTAAKVSALAVVSLTLWAGAAGAQFTAPTSVEPPGVGPLYNLAGGWGVWIGGASLVLTFIGTGIAVIVGRRNRSQGSADAMSHVPWMFGGGLFVSGATVLADAIL